MNRLTRPALTLSAVVLGLGLAGCGAEEVATTPPTGGESAGADAGACTYTQEGDAARPVDLPPEVPAYTAPVQGTIATSAGELSITLAADTAPCTVNSFASLAEQGFYDDTPCPRIVTDPGFQILQCGDPTGTTGGGPGYSFADELTGDETYPAGTLAMANSGPDTQGSQFFIVYGDTGLSPDYTVFGTVDPEDLAGIEEIGAAGSDNSNPAGGGAPKTPIDITSVTVDG